MFILLNINYKKKILIINSNFINMFIDTNNNYDPHKTIFINQNERESASKENLMNDNEIEKLNDDIDSLSKSINEHLNLSHSNTGSTASLSSYPLAPRSRSNNPLSPQTRTPSHSTQNIASTPSHSTQNLASSPIPTTAPIQAKLQSSAQTSASFEVSAQDKPQSSAPNPTPNPPPVEAPIQDKPQSSAPYPPPVEAPIQDKPQSSAPNPTPNPTPNPPPNPPPIEAPIQDKPQSHSPSSSPSKKSDTSNQNFNTIDLESTMCEYCHEKIIGSMINANKKFYHIKHFICSSCSTSLCNVTFHVIDDNLFCNDCYNNKCGVKCAFCNEYINGVSIGLNIYIFISRTIN